MRKTLSFAVTALLVAVSSPLSNHVAQADVIAFSTSATQPPLEIDPIDFSISYGIDYFKVTANYSGNPAAEPTKYTVSVLPSGKSCVINGAQNANCTISNLKVKTKYRISVIATNEFGNSAIYYFESKWYLSGKSPKPPMSKLTLSGFAGDSAKLTKALKKNIKDYLFANPYIVPFSCTGFTAGTPVLKSDHKLAEDRAKAVCDYLKRLRPTAVVTTAGKTPGLAWGAQNRKVIIRGYHAEAP